MKIEKLENQWSLTPLIGAGQLGAGAVGLSATSVQASESTTSKVLGGITDFFMPGGIGGLGDGTLGSGFTGSSSSRK